MDKEQISLRDYFAAKAMQAIIGHYIPKDYHWENGTEDGKPALVKKAYSIADAMMKYREE